MEPDDKKRNYPESPDLKQVAELRARLRTDKAESGVSGPAGRFNKKAGKSAKDIGTYTLIPSLMVAGPVVGYLVGRGAENYLGGEPWGAVIGMLVGVVAAFRQVFLLLARKSDN